MHNRDVQSCNSAHHPVLSCQDSPKEHKTFLEIAQRNIFYKCKAVVRGVSRGASILKHFYPKSPTEFEILHNTYPMIARRPLDDLDAQLLDIFGKSVPIRNFKK